MGLSFGRERYRKRASWGLTTPVALPLTAPVVHAVRKTLAEISRTAGFSGGGA